MEIRSRLEGKRRIALAFAYDGTAFDSFARQPRHRTVEGELVAALQRNGMMRDAREARWEVASRTDRGVSAWWNVCAFDSDVDARGAAHVRTSAPGLFVLSGVSCGREFSPRRHATSRAYRYHVGLDDALDLAAVRSAAKLFRGVHDFRNFCRLEGRAVTRRPLARSGLEGRGEHAYLRFEAPSFLWEQVRRMAHAILMVGRGERSLGSVATQLRGAGLPERPSTPEPLVLERVETGLRFPGPGKATLRRLDDASRVAWARHRFYEGARTSLPTTRR